MVDKNKTPVKPKAPKPNEPKPIVFQPKTLPKPKTLPMAAVATDLQTPIELAAPIEIADQTETVAATELADVTEALATIEPAATIEKEDQTETVDTTSAESETENIKFDNIEIQDIPLSQLSVDSNQPRKHIDKAELDDLIESIKEKGLLYPVIFRIDEKNKKILVSGERRFKAFKALKKETIPAMLINNAKYDEIALIDNIQRVGLHPIDEAEAVTNLMNKYEYTQDQLGNLVGKAQNTISDISQLMELTLEIREDARKRKKLSRSALLKIARIKKPELQQKAYDTLIATLSTHKEKKTRTKLSSSTKAITFVDNGLKVIKKLDFNSLGEEKAEVITKLEELLQEIRGKLKEIEG